MDVREEIAEEVEAGVAELDSSWAKHKWGILRLTLAGLLLLVASLNWGEATASTYGSSGYGGCSYQIDCPSTASTSHASSSSDSSTTSSTSNNTSVSDTSSAQNTATTSSLIIDLSKYGNDQSSAYVAKSAEVDQTIQFSLITSSQKNENHEIYVNAISSNSADITIASTPKSYTVKLGETLQVDVDGDGQNDLNVKLDSITPPTANFLIWQVVKTSKSSTAQKNPTDLAKVIKIASATLAIAISAFEFIAIGKH